MRVCRLWTAEDDAYLAANYATAPLWQMSKHLDRTIPSLKKRAQFLGYRRPHSGTKGMKFPNRQKPTVKTMQRHELYQVCAGWVR